MKYSSRLLIGVLTFALGALAAAAWSKQLGRRVWSPRVFAWRNVLRRLPKIEHQPDSPLLITNPRYFAFASLGSSVGGVLRYTIVNRSTKLVHSYTCRHYSSGPHGNGAYGSHPPEGLSPGQSREDSIAAHDYHELTLTIDFVQFDDGTMWFSGDQRSTVKPEGIRAGAKAAGAHLLRVLEQHGPDAVMESLPRIHADVRGPFGHSAPDEFGSFGFYSGVTSMVVRVNHAHTGGAPGAVEAALRAASD
ncbi:MAG TPA: hypothetical protein VFH46_12480 [Pyrinomonadaceae bacterium]|nr:hypothetical protein [Pyrinomonadaceae bacterium]